MPRGSNPALRPLIWALSVAGNTVDFDSNRRLPGGQFYDAYAT
jgi:hypothetical protein